MSGTNFDPNLGANLQFQCTSFRVLDPASPPPPCFESIPNQVLDPSKPFAIEVEWEGEGCLLPLWMNAMDNNWVIKAYAESVGPGPDVTLAVNSQEPQVPYAGTNNNRKWKHTIQVPAGKLLEGNPTSANSGVYQVSVTIFINSKIPGGYDVSGFTQQSITVRAENPE